MTCCPRSVIALVVTAWLGLTNNVGAEEAGVASETEDSTGRARELNNKATVAFNLGKYEESIQYLTEAYRTYPDPRILFNLAQAYRKTREYARALDLYWNYVRLLPDASNRAAIDKLVVELEGLLATQEASDMRPPQGMAATELPPVVTRIVEPRPWYANSAGWWLAGGGIVAVGTGVGFFISAASVEDELRTAADVEMASIRSDVRTRRTIGTVATVVGGVAVLAGVTIFVASPRTIAREIVPIKDLRLSVTPRAVSLLGRF